MPVSYSGTAITWPDSSTTTSGWTGFKNRIINGAMMIDQRNAGASGTANGYTVDRWSYQGSQASKLTWQQNAGSVTPPYGFTKYLGVTSSSAYSAGSSDYFFLYQAIEGFNVADLAWGTANAQAVTLSFKVYSSLTGTFGGAIYNSNDASPRSYPFSYTVSVANTWTTISVTIAGDTTGSWGTTNSFGITIRFGLGAGSTYSGSAGSWSANNYVSATGATSVVGTNGATFYITGVQLERGSTASSFDYRPYGTELQLCQRYCLKYCGNTLYEDTNCNLIGFNGTTAYGYVATVVPMRSSPSVTSSGLRISDQTNVISVSSVVASGSSYSGPYNINVGANVSSGVVQYRPYQMQANNSTSAYLILSAEL